MSLSTASLASLFLFSGFAVAAISAPGCSSTWQWSSNSLGQNVCTVAAYMMSTCSWGSFNIPPLPPGLAYNGPSGTDDSNLCKCSTVGYSLISACAGCQGAEWISWSEHVTNCTKILPPSSFPNPIPSGTRVPQWALLDVTNENFWNSNKSYATGDSPELGPGTVLGASSSSASVAASTAGSSNTAMSTPVGGHNSNAAAIAGGIVGGLAAISIIIAALLLYLRWRRSQATVVFEGAHVFDLHVNGAAQQPMSEHGTLPETVPETPLTKRYDPNDPTTYPGYQVIQPPPAYGSGQASPLPSPNRSLYSVATPPSPQTQGYRGFPIV